MGIEWVQRVKTAFLELSFPEDKFREYYPHLFFPTQVAVKPLKSGISLLMPKIFTKKTNPFLTKTIEISAYIIQLALAGWLLSQSVSLMLFTASYPLLITVKLYRGASTEDISKGGQRVEGLIAKSARLFAWILKPSSVWFVMGAIGITALAVGLVTKVVSVSSFVVFVLAPMIVLGVLNVPLRMAYQHGLIETKTYLKGTMVFSMLIDIYMIHLGGQRLLGSVFRLSTLCQSPVREYAKAALAVSFSSIMLDNETHHEPTEAGIAPWAALDVGNTEIANKILDIVDLPLNVLKDKDF